MSERYPSNAVYLIVVETVVTGRQAYPSGAGKLFTTEACRFVHATAGVQLSMETSAPIQPLTGNVMPQDTGKQMLAV